MRHNQGVSAPFPIFEVLSMKLVDLCDDFIYSLLHIFCRFTSRATVIVVTVNAD